MNISQSGQETAPTVPCPKSAFLCSRAPFHYPVANLAASGYAAVLLQARFGMTPTMAQTIASLSGLGNDQ